jgi:hypothetical protein
MEQLAQGHGPDARFIRWFFSTGGDRTIFPASAAKIGEWVDNVLLTNPNVAEEWLRNALVCVPNHPLLHIALAGSETDSKRTDFLRLFGFRKRACIEARDHGEPSRAARRGLFPEGRASGFGDA